MAFLKGAGFLGTHATFYSDATLVLTLLTAVLLTIGWRLAVAKRFEAHRWVQTAAVALNSAVVLGVMVVSFWTFILPGLPGRFFEGSFGITTVHALVGSGAALLGIFVALRGNGLVPKFLRFSNYKLFMRAAYTLYMLATLLGVAVYVIVFMFGI